MARHGLFEIDQPGAGDLAHDDVGVAFDARQVGKHSQGGRGKMQRLGAGLAVGQPRFAALEIDPVPFEIEDFGQPRAGEYQQLDSGNHVR